MTAVIIFLVFMKIGAVSYGGGYAIISMIIAEMEALGMTMQEITAMTALDLVVPGPIAVNAATYIGYIKAGFLGALFGTMGLMLPSYAYILPAVHFLKKFENNRYLQGALTGIKPAAIGLVAGAGAIIGREAFFADYTWNFPCVGIFVVSLILLIKFKVDPIFMTVLAGVAGLLIL